MGKYENWERVTRKKTCEISSNRLRQQTEKPGLEVPEHIKASYWPVRISLPLLRLQTTALEKFPLDPSSYQNVAR